MFSTINNSLQVYAKYLTMVVFFSIPFVIALMLPYLSPAPVFSALGGYFLRSGSLPELKTADMGIILALSVLSLFFLSLALVAINLVVKSSRTRTKVSAEALRGLGKYTMVVLAIFVAVKVVETLILIYVLATGAPEIPVLIFSFLASIGLFYVAPAVVLEEKKPAPAFISSYRHVLKKPLHFVMWLAVAFILLAIVSSLSFSLFSEAGVRQGFIVLVNSLVVLPFLFILQAQMYLAKYTIVR